MKAVLFDLDGCLAESEILCLTAFSDGLAALGIALDWRAVRDRFLGQSLPEILGQLAAEHGRPIPPGFQADFEARVQDLYRAGLRPVPGAVALLQSLGKAPRAIVTGGSLHRMGFTLQLAGLDGFFGPHGYSGEQVARGKPHPDLFLFAARQLGVAPQDCLVLEDSPHGVAGARAAGMGALGFVGGTHLEGIRQAHAARLMAAGAAQVVASLAEAQARIAEHL